MNPTFNYENMHRIEYITQEVVDELREGSISFYVYAYPPSVQDIPKEDGGIALKKRMTMKKAARGDYELDPEEEAKLLGLDGAKER